MESNNHNSQENNHQVRTGSFQGVLEVEFYQHRRNTRFRLAIAFSSVALTYNALLVWFSNLVFLDGNGPSFLFNNIRSIVQCQGIRDSLGFWNPRRGFRIPGTGFPSLSVELGFWIPSAIQCDSRFLSCILDSEAQNSGFHKQNSPDSGFHKQKFPGFQKPDSPFT